MIKSRRTRLDVVRLIAELFNCTRSSELKLNERPITLVICYYNGHNATIRKWNRKLSQQNVNLGKLNFFLFLTYLHLYWKWKSVFIWYVNNSTRRTCHPRTVKMWKLKKNSSLLYIKWVKPYFMYVVHIRIRRYMQRN